MLKINSNPLKRYFVPAILTMLLNTTPASAQDTIPADTLNLREVEVFGARNTILPAEIIRFREFRSGPVRDIGEMLRARPNLSGVRKGGTSIDPVIRGFRFSQVSVTLDRGIQIEGGCPNRMDPVTSHVESEEIAGLEVIRGPYALSYAAVMGALVNMQRYQPVFSDKPELHGSVSYGFESNWNGQREHAMISWGSRKVAIRADGGFKNYGSYQSGEGKLYNTSFRKSYASAAAAFRIGSRQRVTLSYAYNNGSNLLFPALPMDQQEDRMHLASLSYLASGLGRVLNSMEGLAYFSSVHHVMDNYDRPAAKTMKAVSAVDAATAGGKVIGTITAGKVRIRAGFDFLHIYKDGNKHMDMTMVMQGDTFRSEKNVNIFNRAVWNNAALFGELSGNRNIVEYSASIRIDYNQANSSDTFKLAGNGVALFDKLSSEHLNVSLNAGARVKPVDRLIVSGSVGLGTRSPSILERFIKLMPVQYDSYDYLGNPQLKPEQNYQADLSLTWEPQFIGTLSLGGFYSYIRNYITGEVIPPSVIKPSTQGAPGVKQFNNIKGAILYGFEFSYKSPERFRWHLSAWLAATAGINPSAKKYIVTGGQVTGEETIKNDPLPEIPPLEGSLNASYSFFHGKLVPGAVVRLVAAQKSVSAAYGEKTTPGFGTLSASLSYLPCRYFSVSAGVSNIFDKNYYEHLNRRIVGTTENLHEPGRVFYVNLAVRF